MVSAANRVLETASNPAAADFDLGGVPDARYQSAVDGIGNGVTGYYTAVHRSAAEYEIGSGAVTDAAPDTWARSTIIESSNADAKVTFSAGTVDVFSCIPAQKAVFKNPAGYVVIGEGGHFDFNDRNLTTTGTVTLGTIELGHATDTTIARASAGVVTIAGTQIAMAGGAYHDGFSDFVANEHIDWTSASDNFRTTGLVQAGSEDVSRGWLVAYGHGAGSTIGGILSLYTAADHDTTIDSWSLRASSSSLKILQVSPLLATTDILTFDASGHANFHSHNLSAVGTIASGTHTISSDLTLAAGSVTSASGALSLGSNNVSTTGTLASGAATISGNIVMADNNTVIQTRNAADSAYWNAIHHDTDDALYFGLQHAKLYFRCDSAVQMSIDNNAIDCTDCNITTTGTVTSAGIVSQTTAANTGSRVRSTTAASYFRVDGEGTGTVAILQLADYGDNHVWEFAMRGTDHASQADDMVWQFYNGSTYDTWAQFDTSTNAINFQGKALATTGTITADAYVETSTAWKPKNGSALAMLLPPEEYWSKTGKLDHKKFFGYRKIKKSNGEEGKEVEQDALCISDEIAMLRQACYELREQNKALLARSER